MPGELRLLSLLSSATEILHALGLGPFQVGRSHECDFPEAVHALPICSRPNIPIDVSSRDIDASVRGRAANALSIYDLDADLISSLRPTHVFTQTQCKVCAVSLDDVEAALERITGVHPRVISLEPHALADVWQDIRRVARATNTESAGEQLITSLQARLERIASRAAQAPARPRVATIEWLEPLMVAGNWIPELIELAHADNLFGQPGAHSPYCNWTDLERADPDVIIAFPCGFDLDRTRHELYWLTDRPEWARLRAVRAGRAYFCDGNQFLNRPGPRLVESLQIFAELLHPDIFAPTLRAHAWDLIPAPATVVSG